MYLLTQASVQINFQNPRTLLQELATRNFMEIPVCGSLRMITVRFWQYKPSEPIGIQRFDSLAFRSRMFENAFGS